MRENGLYCNQIGYYSVTKQPCSLSIHVVDSSSRPGVHINIKRMAVVKHGSQTAHHPFRET